MKNRSLRFCPEHAAQHLEKQCLSLRQQEMPAYLVDESGEKMCSSGKALTTFKLTRKKKLCVIYEKGRLYNTQAKERKKDFQPVSKPCRHTCLTLQQGRCDAACISMMERNIRGQALCGKTVPAAGTTTPVIHLHTKYNCRTEK